MRPERKTRASRRRAARAARALPALWLLIHGGGALAQVAPPAAPTLTPGGIFETLPEQRQPVLPATPPETLFPAPAPGTRQDPGAPRFIVNAFQFTGNTVFKSPELKQRIEGYVNMQLNLYELTRAADIITRYYRDRGYPIARAIIPAQKVEKGVVRIEVIEGRIGKFSVTGNKRYPEARILSRLSELPRDRPVTTSDLERRMLLINDLPGLTARATLEPGATFGDTDILVRAQEKPVDAVLSMDNHGRKEIGQWRADGALTLNNPLKFGDQLSLRLIEAQDDLLTFGRVGYSVPLTADGLRLAGAYSRVNYRIGEQFAVLGIKGEVQNSELSVSYPLVRSRATTYVLTAGVRRTTTDQTALGIPITHTAIILGSVGFAGTWVHEDSAVTNAFATLSGNGKSNPDGTRQDAQRGKLEIDVNHLRAATKNWDLFLRANWVGTLSPLSDTEKFSLGGPDSVRGYQPSELRGDAGWLATVEVRRQYQIFNHVGIFDLFYDQGAAHNKSANGVDSIRSAGLGTTFYLSRNLRAKAEYAFPISDRVSSDGNRGRAWFTLTGSF